MRFLSTAALCIALLGGAAGETTVRQREEAGAERVQFPTEDGVTVYADLHDRRAAAGAPVLVFFHDATSSRGEVRPVLKPFRQRGYVTLAVDLRVGQNVKKVQNYTARRFPEQHEGQDILSAGHDLAGALAFARERYPQSKVVAVGCSFSAAHALRLAGTRPGLVDGVVAFSPAEYFTHLVDSPTYVRDAMGGVTCPVLILSARAELPDWQPLLEAMPSTNKRGFVPEGRGRHGLRALYEDTAESDAYWDALDAFLGEHFPATGGSAGDRVGDEGSQEEGKDG